MLNVKKAWPSADRTPVGGEIPEPRSEHEEQSLDEISFDDAVAEQQQQQPQQHRHQGSHGTLKPFHDTTNHHEHGHSP